MKHAVKQLHFVATAMAPTKQRPRRAEIAA